MESNALDTHKFGYFQHNVKSRSESGNNTGIAEIMS